MDQITGISELLASIKSLPPLPSGVSRMMGLRQNAPNYFEQASMIVRSDPALAGQVIKIANSALYAGQASVDTLDRAIMRVGIRMVVGSLTSSHMRRSFKPAQDDLAEIWVSNLLSALLCRSLAERCPILRMVPETAYTYGLLHDVGRLGLVALYRNGMVQLLEEEPHPVLELSEAERRFFGVAHHTVGRMICTRWKFPAEITLVIAAHHLPRAQRINYPAHLRRMIDLVNLSDHIGVFLHEAAIQGEDAEVHLLHRLDFGAPLELIDELGLPIGQIIESIEPSLRHLARQTKVLGIPGATRLTKLVA